VGSTGLSSSSHFLINTGQLGLALLAAVFLACLSFVIWVLKGKVSTYYVSQYFGLGFIVMAVLFLTIKLTNTKMEQHLGPHPHSQPAPYGD
jgi:cbb3-type cytochrome oxidase subunit 1